MIDNQTDIKCGRYAFTKVGRAIYVRSISNDGIVSGVDIDKADRIETTISLENIEHFVDEVCKNITVE